MFKSVVAVITIFCFLVSSAFAQKDYYLPKYSTILDSTKGVKCLKQCSRATPETNVFFKISPKDSALLIKNFRKILKEKATSCCLVGGSVQSLADYCFQFIGVVNGGKKYVYINAFRMDKDNFEKGWKTEPIIFCDGGTSAWGIMFDLKTESFSQLAFNGVG